MKKFPTILMKNQSVTGTSAVVQIVAPFDGVLASIKVGGYATIAAGTGSFDHFVAKGTGYVVGAPALQKTLAAVYGACSVETPFCNLFDYNTPVRVSGGEILEIYVDASAGCTYGSLTTLVFWPD